MSEKFMKHYVYPFKGAYISLGALILLLSVLKGFEENAVSYFLIALVCFGMFILFIHLLFKIFLVKKEDSLFGMLYGIFFTLFFIGFFLLIYTQFEKLFNVFLGITLGFTGVYIFGQIRKILLAIHKKIKFKSFILKKFTWILFSIILLTLYILALYFLAIYFTNNNVTYDKLSEIPSQQLILFPLILLLCLGFIPLILFFIIDIFKKEPLGYNLESKYTKYLDLILMKDRKKQNKQRETS